MVPEYTHTQSRWPARLLTLALVVACAAIWHLQGAAIEGYLVQRKQTYSWRVLTQEEVASGATIPANTHVVFHLPGTFLSIPREVLLGHKGEAVRYWGYCIPQNAPDELVNTRSGFPGLLFLSEKEREIRAAVAARNQASYSPSGRLPTAEELEAQSQQSRSAIRHQVESFKPNTMCYIMTAESLAIGLDHDGDRLNDKIEREINTNPKIPDTDGDGIIDGIEYLTNTNPIIRDTDGDGIIDGIEDKNWNGKQDADETNPRLKDSDRDGLCDGLCRVRLQRREYYMGEDQNLNGQVDEGETDPRKYSTKNDGISDQVPYIQCLTAGKQQCP